MVYTLKQAAEAAGKGKPAILKAIKNGRLSAKKNEKGQWNIDPSELHRVYPPVSVSSSSDQKSARQETPSELIELRVKVKALEDQLRKSEEQCEKWEKQAERVTLLLTDNNNQTKSSGLLGGLKRMLWGNDSK